MRIRLILLIITVLTLLSGIAFGQTTRAAGDWMCPCPGKHKPLGSAANCNVVCYGSSGGSGSSSDPTQKIEQIFVNELIKGLFSSPQDDSAKRAADDARAAEQKRQSDELAATQKREAEERAAEQGRLADESKDRLLGNNKGSDPSSLSLMGVDTSSELKLLDQSADASSSLRLMADDQRPSTAGAGSKSKVFGYNKGYDHASQCISQNSTVCMGAPKEQQKTCIDDYRAGYAAGDKQRVLVMKEAFQVGVAAGRAVEDNRNGFNDARALGPCRLEWLDAYRRGHETGSPAKALR